MNIKVCGITQLKQLQQLDALNIDFAGLIFYEKSPRFVGDKIDPEALTDADFDVRKVGVFVDAGFDHIMEKVESYSLDLVQLHGNESVELCEDLSEEIEVIKAFQIDEKTKDIDKLVAPYDHCCDYYLFDTSAAGKNGGTGRQFDWSIFENARIEKPFFLSGGIGVDDAERISALQHPDLFAVDINSKFETQPGIKDMKQVLQFKESLKSK